MPRLLPALLCMVIALSSSVRAQAQTFADAVVSATAVGGQDQAAHVPNGAVAELYEANSSIVLRLPLEASQGSQVSARMRRRSTYSTSDNSVVELSVSRDGTTWDWSTNVTVLPGSSVSAYNVNPGVPYRFVRIRHLGAASGDFELDAIVASNTYLPSCGILSNGGIEAGLTDWANAANISASADAFLGYASLRIPTGQWTSTGASVVPGDVIRVNLFGKRFGGATRGDYRLEFYGAGGYLTTAATGSFYADIYTENAIGPVTAPPGATYVVVGVNPQGSGGGILIDNVCLTKETPACGVLTDAGFGDALSSYRSSWQLSSGASLRGDSAIVGSQNGYIGRDIYGGLLGGEEYELNVTTQSPSGGAAIVTLFSYGAASPWTHVDRGYSALSGPARHQNVTVRTPLDVTRLRIGLASYSRPELGNPVAFFDPCIQLKTHPVLGRFATSGVTQTSAERQVRGMSGRALPQNFSFADVTTIDSILVTATFRGGASPTAADAVYVRADGVDVPMSRYRVNRSSTYPVVIYAVTLPRTSSVQYVNTVGQAALEGLSATAFRSGVAGEDLGGLVAGYYGVNAISDDFRVPLATSFTARDVEVEVPLGALVADGRQIILHAEADGAAAQSRSYSFNSPADLSAGYASLTIGLADVPSTTSSVRVRIESPTGTGEPILPIGPITALGVGAQNVVVTGIGLCNGAKGHEMVPGGDFGTVETVGGVRGTQLPGITWGPPPTNINTPGYTYCIDTEVPDGGFAIATSTAGIYDLSGTGGPDAWTAEEDHGPEPDGYAMLVDASFDPGVFFYQQIDNLCEGTEYVFSAAILNVDNPLYGPHGAAAAPYNQQRILPNVDFVIAPVGTQVADLNTVSATYQTGDILNDGLWHEQGFSFTVPVGVTSVILAVRNNAPGGGGNDIMLDDISMRACGPDLVVESDGLWCGGNAELSINAAASGAYPSPSYQWQVSSDYGQSWSNVPGATTGTLRPSGYRAGDRWRLATAASIANLGNPQCRVYSNELTAGNRDCTEICGNGIDDDLDGLVDCADPDCASQGPCGCSAAEGNARVQYWLDVPGAQVADLEALADYPNRDYLEFSVGSLDLPDGFGDNYGARLTGMLRAPTTGDYTFNVVGDNGARFSLSSDRDPANLVGIAAVNGGAWTAPGQHDKFPSQTSATVSLVADHVYYFEGLLKEFYGGDHLEVYWRTPTNPTVWEIVPGSAILFPGTACPAEICDNVYDDDGDGATDCEDESCPNAAPVTRVER